MEMSKARELLASRMGPKTQRFDGCGGGGRPELTTQDIAAAIAYVQDGLGLVLLRRAGIATALVSARRSEAALARGRELGIDHLHLGEKDKLGCLRRIAAERGLGLEAVAFMGDDLPDLPVLRAVGLAIAPANVHPWLRADVHWITPLAGGEGAVRQACDLLLQAQGKVEALLAREPAP